MCVIHGILEIRKLNVNSDFLIYYKHLSYSQNHIIYNVLEINDKTSPTYCRLLYITDVSLRYLLMSKKNSTIITKYKNNIGYTVHTECQNDTTNIN